jgi:hypothetical protein
MRQVSSEAAFAEDEGLHGAFKRLRRNEHQLKRDPNQYGRLHFVGHRCCAADVMHCGGRHTRGYDEHPGWT